MNKTPILLVLLVIIGALSTGLGDITKIPASNAISIDMGNLKVYNNTSTFKCEVQTGEKTSSMVASIVQFNISSLNISEDDIGILVLKVAGVAKYPNATNMVVLMPMGSYWDESSGYLGLIANLEPILSLIQKKDVSQMEVSTNDGQLFDVSRILNEAKGDKISFLLMAFSDKNYSVEFKSIKSDSEPCLVVMPYPGNGDLKVNNSSFVSHANTSMKIDRGAIYRTKLINKSILGNETLQINGSAIANETKQMNEDTIIDNSKVNKSSNDALEQENNVYPKNPGIL